MGNKNKTWNELNTILDWWKLANLAVFNGNYHIYVFNILTALYGSNYGKKEECRIPKKWSAKRIIMQNADLWYEFSLFLDNGVPLNRKVMCNPSNGAIFDGVEWLHPSFMTTLFLMWNIWKMVQVWDGCRGARIELTLWETHTLCDRPCCDVVQSINQSIKHDNF